VGININQQLFAEPIVARATSMRTFLDRSLSLDEVRDELLASMQLMLNKYHDRAILLHDLRKELTWMSTLAPVNVTQPDGFTIAGARIIGISDSGALHISSRDGVEHTVQTATITFGE
jgi:biotin-(acetyl-CoA carboxylase) ligase